MDCSLIDNMLLADVGVCQSRCCSVARDGDLSRIREEPPVVVGVSLEYGQAVRTNLFASATTTLGCARASRFVSQRPRRCGFWR